MNRKWFVGKPGKDIRRNSKEDKQQSVPVQATASCGKGASSVGTLSISKHQQLQQSHAASSGNEELFGVSAGWRPAEPQPQS